MNPIAQYHPQAWTWEPPMVILRHCFPHTHQAPEGEGQDEKEAMFEKLLTPSDVGKLNRLVVPKQHAEKYFPPLGGGGGGCVDYPAEKGLLLSFEDESSGKLWRFRYSYWSSSQSYVVTRGWSRFVKEKSLDAGDTVCFERLRNRGDRLYINCRRRERNESTPAVGGAVIPASLTTMSMAICEGDGGKATAAPTQSKRLRLFGVNLDCVPEVEIDAAGVGSSLRNRAFISVNDLGDSSL